MVRPYLRTIQPIPPAWVSPPTPTEIVSPDVIARPCLRQLGGGRTPGGAGADAYPAVTEQLDLVEPGQVDDDTVVDVAESQSVVAAAADGQRESFGAGVGERCCHLVRRLGTQDDRGFGRAGDRGACRVVVGVAGADGDVVDGHSGVPPGRSWLRVRA